MVKNAEHSEDPMAWQKEADNQRDAGNAQAADICHNIAGEMMRSANDADAPNVETVQEQE